MNQAKQKSPANRVDTTPIGRQDWYSVPEAARYCRLPRSTLWRAIRSGDLESNQPAYDRTEDGKTRRANARLLIQHEAIERFIRGKSA